MRIDTSGRVGIGTSSPTAALTVVGDISASSNTTVSGNVTVAGNIAAKYQDVAEWVDTPEAIEPGTVVVIDPERNNNVVPASVAYDTRVAGAVSRQPGRGAIGSFDIDTRMLTNGRHSIAWGVTDSAGRSEGIGSREFIVLNGGALMARGASAALADAPVVLGDVRDLSAEVADRPVWGRVGFDFGRGLENVTPDPSGVHHLRIPELGRLELWLGNNVSAGYLAVGEQLRPLPVGSQLDPDTGLFTWAPLAGYIGAYDLVFLAGDARLPITVTIIPATQPTTGQMRGYIDAPAEGSPVSRGLR